MMYEMLLRLPRREEPSLYTAHDLIWTHPNSASLRRFLALAALRLAFPYPSQGRAGAILSFVVMLADLRFEMFGDTIKPASTRHAHALLGTLKNSPP